MSAIFSRLFLLFSIALLPSYGQVSSAISGSVSDPQGRRVASASLVAVHADTGKKFVSTSNEVGFYRFSGLPVGRYNLTASSPGFQHWEAREVVLHVGQERAADIELAVAGASGSIAVTEPAGLVDTESSPSRIVHADEVQNLPLNGRQLQNLALLAPGIAAGWNWSTAANRYGKARENLEGAFSVNGARARSNNFTLDGISFNLRQYGVINFEPSVEAVEEFRLVHGTIGAQYASSMGSAVVLVTRSGGESYHGSLYEFVRNDKFDATDTFNRSAGLAKGKLRQNQFGGTLSGPIFGKSNFFFVNTELMRIVEGVETRVTSVPTADERRGLLRVSGSTLDLSSRIHPVSRNLLALFPAPNRQGDLNYNSSLTIRLNDYQTNVRTDHYLSGKDLLTVRYSWNLNDQEYVINRFGGPFIPGFSLPNPEATHNAGVGHTRTFGPALVNELRVGVNRYRNPLANGDTRSAASIGLPNASTANGIPSIDFRGGTLESLGGLAWFNRDQNETTYQISDAMSRLAGRHSLKLGGQLLRQHFNTRGAYNQRGTIRFDGTRNSLVPNVPGNERAALIADFLLGLPAEASITTGQFGRGYRQWAWSLFGEDSWRVSPKLTLNLGGRYDLTLPWKEVNDKLSNLVPGLGLLTSGDAGFSGLYRGDRNNFGPRVGFAYDTNGSGATVLRGGFGIVHETLLQANSVELIENNAPYSASAVTRTPTPFGPGSDRATTLLDLTSLAAFSRSIGAVGSFANPYSMQWSFGVQHRTASGWMVDLGYAALRGINLPVYRNANQINLGALTAVQRSQIANTIREGKDTTALLQPLRRYPEFDSITISENIASSSYHSGQFRVSRRLDRGLLLDASYTIAKSIDNASDFNSGDPSEQVLDAHNLRAQRGASSFDVRHRVTVSGQYALPFKGTLLRGWTLNSVATMQSAQPFTPFLPSFDAFRNEAFNRPDVIGDPLAGVPDGLAFNPRAFAAAPAGQFGNAGRNIVRGDSFRSVDLSIFRAFRMERRGSLQFRFEFVNSLNAVNYQGPVVDLTSVAGAFVAAAPPRIAQLGVKYQF